MSDPFAATEDGSLSDGTSVAVAAVYDGDTFVTEADRTVRLWGIDAPESEQPYGEEATHELAGLIENAAQLYLYVKDTDQYGRTVAVLYDGSLDLNEELLRRGAAWYYERYAPSASDYQAAQDIAQMENVGLWRGQDDPIPPWEWRHTN